jgi:hypothetical protein
MIVDSVASEDFHAYPAYMRAASTRHMIATLVLLDPHRALGAPLEA